MITVISGTDRPQSNTLKVANCYFNLLLSNQVSAQLFSLEGQEIYKDNEALKNLEQQYLWDATKFLFVIPEYNGSFPGALKLMIDHTNIRKCWWGKKASMIGVSDGRAGNLRGMDHLTSILQYLKMHVHHNKLPISKIAQELNPDGTWANPETEVAVQAHLIDFIQF